MAELFSNSESAPQSDHRSIRDDSRREALKLDLFGNSQSFDSHAADQGQSIEAERQEIKRSGPTRPTEGKVAPANMARAPLQRTRPESANRTSVNQRTVKTEPVKKSAAKQSSEKRKKKTGKTVAIVASCFGLVLAACAAAVAVYLSTREEPFIPADILAGYEESAPVYTANVVSDTALDYLTNDRYDVRFTFYESPDVVCNTSEISVGELMDKMGVVCGENNRMAESPEDVISSDTVIDIKTITYETAYATESIAYDTEYVDVRTIPKGSTSVKQNGQNGVKTYTYTCTLVNGVEESRELVGEKITEYPTTRVLYRGVGGTITSGGVTYNYSYYIDVRATCYSIVGTTASGLPTSTSVMAVDPRVIPLGTRCVVVGGGDYGYRIAADTGGAIKGNTIDLWYPAGTFSGFGWRSTRVYILE